MLFEILLLFAMIHGISGDVCQMGIDTANTTIDAAWKCHMNADCDSILTRKSSKVHTLLSNWMDAMDSPDLRVQVHHGTWSEYLPLDQTIVNDLKAEATSFGYDKEVVFDVDGQKVTKYYKIQPVSSDDRYIWRMERWCGMSSGILPIGTYSLDGYRQLSKSLGLTNKIIPLGLKKYRMTSISTNHYRLSWSNGRPIMTGTSSEIEAAFQKCAQAPSYVTNLNHHTLQYDSKQWLMLKL